MVTNSGGGGSDDGNDDRFMFVPKTNDEAACGIARYNSQGWVI
jgi:hypothetical protein